MLLCLGSERISNLKVIIVAVQNKSLWVLPTQQMSFKIFTITKISQKTICTIVGFSYLKGKKYKKQNYHHKRVETEILLLATKSENSGASWTQGSFLKVEPWLAFDNK